MPTLICVCLCTYRRPQLAQTLASIAAQQLPRDYEVAISIADNDPKGSGKAIVDRFRQQTTLDISYQIQPVKNIALTRNASVSNAKGDWLAFIDDDEVADNDWLASLLACAAKYDADAVVGQVNTIYPAQTPTWIRDGDLLGRQTAVTGTRINVGLTGNALVKRASMPDRYAPFDPDLGTTGGEDSAFFLSIHCAGGRIVTCREAIVSETAESHRLNADYLLAQATRVGETYARTFIAPARGAAKVIELVKAIIKVGWDGILAMVLRPFGRHLSFRYRMGMNNHLGKLRYMFKVKPVEMYK